MRNLIVFIIQFHDCRVYKHDKRVTEFSEFSPVRLTDGNTSLIICIQAGLSIPVVIHNRQSLSLPIRRSFATWSNEYEKYKYSHSTDAISPQFLHWNGKEFWWNSIIRMTFSWRWCQLSNGFEYYSDAKWRGRGIMEEDDVWRSMLPLVHGKLPRNCGKYSIETSLQYCYAYVFERVG